MTLMLGVRGRLSIGLPRTNEVHLGDILSLKQPDLHHALRRQNVFSFLQPTQQESSKNSGRLGYKTAV